MRRRHRHGPYQLARSRRSFSLEPLRPIIALLIVGALLYLGGSWLLGIFTGSSQSQSASVTLSPGERGVVQVSLEGGEWKRSDSEIKLYIGDRVSTDGNATANVSLFDGTVVALDQNTVLRIDESYQEEGESGFVLLLEEGRLWANTPGSSTQTGSTVREIQTEAMLVQLTGGTEAIVEPRTMHVFLSEGLGNTIRFPKSEHSVIVGEGQTFSLPEDATLTGDLYRYRSPLDPLVETASFVRQSRNSIGLANRNTPGSSANIARTLTVTAPEDGATVRSGTLVVEGTYGEDVENIRVNGYQATLEQDGTYSIELALPDGNSITITVEAIDENGIPIEEIRRQVVREAGPAPTPEFTQPAQTGQTYRTSDEEIEIVGSAPAGTVAIIVNDYQLQFFEPGDRTWTYLARTNLNNLQRGRNVFRAVAVNEDGERSEPAELTIIVGQGSEGVVEEDDPEDQTDTETEEEFPDPSTLPQNDPLQPGTISVTAPTEGSVHRGSESDLLIEGSTSTNTDTVWVNDYQLRLYEPESTSWNYIANEELGTMDPGNNQYEIVSRNADGEILDRFIYTIVYTPQEEQPLDEEEEENAE